MTSGLDWNEPLTGVPQTLLALQRSPNWQEFILARRVVREPGTAFDYNSGNAHLLSMALARRTGMSTDAYARKVLFEPLGIRDIRWLKDPQGVAIGGFGLYMHTRDMARIGQLYLQHGAWNGRQLVPREWVDRVFDPKTEMNLPGFRYADFWWSLPARRTYMMSGFNRQLVMVMPDLDLVVATTGRGNYALEEFIHLVQRAASSSVPLPENADMQARLRARTEAAADGFAVLPGDPVKPSLMQGSFRLDDNTAGCARVQLRLHGPSAALPHAHRHARTGGARGPGGTVSPKETTKDGRCSPAATWRDPNTLLVEQRWPEEAAWVHSLIRFSGNELEINTANGFGMVSVVKGRRSPAE
jgi:hypothetical protein